METPLAPTGKPRPPRNCPMSSSVKVWMAALLLLPLVVTGCGDSSAVTQVGKLQGKVTLDGVPVRTGTVIAAPVDDSIDLYGRGDIDEDGNYVIEKAPA